MGRALAMRLLQEGWEVDLTGRNPRRFDPSVAALGARYIESDRRESRELISVFGGVANLLVDCVCYTAAEARQLVTLAKTAGSTVMISSKALYVDEHGKHSNSPGGPSFVGPIRESQTIMAPSDVDFNSAEGYGANKAAAELVLLESGLPISIVRPSKIHGVGAQNPREWFFVKRILDRRPTVLLANAGIAESPTASVNLAEIILAAAARPEQRILNAADPDAPDIKTMAGVVASHMGYEWNEVLLPPDAPAGLGRTPWNKTSPVILDTTAALELGYEPVGDYASTVGDEIDWLVEIAIRTNGIHLPDVINNQYFEHLFDYQAEDDYLAASGRF